MSKFIGICIGVCLSVSLYGQNIDIRPYIEKGNQLFDSAQYRSAATLYKHALILDSSSFDAWFNFATALYATERYVLANGAFKRAAAIQSDQILKAEALYGSGNSYVRLRQYNKALEQYKQSLLLNPHDEDARYNYAYTKILRDQQEKERESTDNNQEEQEKVPPSKFALEVKKQADELVEQFKFLEATMLMLEASEKDDTIEPNFGDFIQSLSQIAQIIVEHNSQ